MEKYEPRCLSPSFFVPKSTNPIIIPTKAKIHPIIIIIGKINATPENTLAIMLNTESFGLTVIRN